MGSIIKIHQTYRPLNLTQAEKTKIENYSAGQYLIFHMGKNPGSIHEIEKTHGDTIYFKNGERTSIDKAANYNLFEAEKTAVGKGEKIRLNGRAESIEGKQLFNGSIFEVREHDHEGRIILENGATLPKDFGRFSHGYVSTSHASQGKTVDKIIISQSAMSGRAATNKQLYVSMTRGRKQIAWYTDDKETLLDAAGRTGDRKSATELVHNVNEMNRRKRSNIKQKEIEVDKPKTEKKKPWGLTK